MAQFKKGDPVRVRETGMLGRVDEVVEGAAKPYRVGEMPPTRARSEETPPMPDIPTLRSEWYAESDLKRANY